VVSDSRKTLTAIGLMSGTSLDGIDVAIIETDGDGVSSFGQTLSLPYPAGFREALRGLLGRKLDGDSQVSNLVTDLTLRHAEAVNQLLGQAGLTTADIDVIGFHGQTVFHDPDNGVTCQLGDGAVLARETGIKVINDFRSNDVAHGGEGAPLAPVFHVALSRSLERPVAFLNIGGVANVTWVSPDGGAIAFDTGPGNALIDDWVLRSTGQSMDEDGKLARAGKVDEVALASLMDHPYFARDYPKSLDRDDFSTAPIEGLSAEDGAATLTAFTSQAVAVAAKMLPAPPLKWLITGGGRHNNTTMAALRRSLPAPVEPVETEGWDGDALEAQAFAYLAVRSLRGLPLSFPQTTGVKYPVTGGVRHDV